MNNQFSHLYLNTEWRDKMENRNEIRSCIHEIRLLKNQCNMTQYSLYSYAKFEDMINSKYRELKNKLNQRMMNIRLVKE